MPIITKAIEILKPSNIESTALGAGILAGLKSCFWKSADEVFQYKKIDKKYTPQMHNSKRKKLINGWKKAIKKTNN